MHNDDVGDVLSGGLGDLLGLNWKFVDFSVIGKYWLLFLQVLGIISSNVTFKRKIRVRLAMCESQTIQD